MGARAIHARNRNRRSQSFVRFFHDDSTRAWLPEARQPASRALSVRLLASAQSFRPHAHATAVAGRVGAEASFSSVTTFDTDGELIESYDPTGRVNDPDAAVAAVQASFETVPSLPAAEPAQAEQSPAPRAGEEASQTPEKESSETVADGAQGELSPEELQRIDAADEDEDFLGRLKAVRPPAEPVAPAAPNPPAPPKPVTSQSRHAIFDELTPLLQRAQTYHFGTHRVDRARLEALAASVLAEDEAQTRARTARSEHEEPAAPSTPEPEEKSGAKNQEELALEGDELRQAVAGIGSHAPAEAEASDEPAGDIPAVERPAESDPAEQTVSSEEETS